MGPPINCHLHIRAGGVKAGGGGGVSEEMRRHLSRHVDYLFRSLKTPEVSRFILKLPKQVELQGVVGREVGRVEVFLTMAMTHTLTHSHLRFRCGDIYW